MPNLAQPDLHAFPTAWMGRFARSLNPGGVDWAAGILHGVATLVVAALVVSSTRWLFEDRVEWLTFLGGVLLASVISLATRLSHARASAGAQARRVAELQEEVARCAADRQSAQRLARSATRRLGQVASNLKVPIVYLDAARKCQYTNDAMNEHLEAATGARIGLLGRDALLADLAGAAEWQAATDDVLGGLKREVPLGTGRLTLQPDADTDGRIVGIFGFIEGAVPAPAPVERAPEAAVSLAESPDDAASRIAATRYLLSALERDMFSVVALPVVPLDPRTAGLGMVQPMLRMRAEEEAGVPPGEFLGIVGEQGLMPILDRWLVLDVLQRCRDQIHRRPGQRLPLIKIRAGMEALADVSFVAVVMRELKAFDIPGSMLCFEIEADDLISEHPVAAAAVANVRTFGAQIIVCGFGGGAAELHLLAAAPPHFIELAGGLVRQLAEQPAARARVRAIVEAARLLGVRTIAPMVEDSATVAAVEAAGVDYVQGFVLTEPATLETVLLESTRGGDSG